VHFTRPEEFLLAAHTYVTVTPLFLPQDGRVGKGGE
jgi:hypothetical protein